MAEIAGPQTFCNLSALAPHFEHMRHTWLRFSGLLGAFVLVLALAAPAQADDVDWTAYIDTSQPARASSSRTPAKTSRAKVAKRAGKKLARAKVKARSKKKKARR
jgi:hypothetical protein